MIVEGSTSGEVFETYVEHFLAPTLRTGQVVVMNNLSAHKESRVRERIEERGCALIYLPPSEAPPDLNPIQPYSRGVFQDQAVTKRDESSCTRGVGGSHGQGTRCGPCPGRGEHLRALCLPYADATTMKGAVGSQKSSWIYSENVPSDTYNARLN